MKISLDKLKHTFFKKPLLVGGKAMEYYGLRKAGADIDFIADEQDVIELIKQYPNKVKNLYSDLGVCPYEFEIWRSIQLFKRNDLIEGAVEEEEYFIIALDKLLIMKALGMTEEKYLQDTKLIAKKINENQYLSYEEEKDKVDKIMNNLTSITYLEKTGTDE